MIMTVCKDRTTLCVSELKFDMWDFYQRKGITEIKDRIYKAVQRIIIMGFDPDLDFYRDYENINKINISETGVFYKIHLINETDNKQIEVLMPLAVFDDKMDDEKMHNIVTTWFAFMSSFFEQNPVYSD